jgi:DNA-binding PadR family transcriptional regulator
VSSAWGHTDTGRRAKFYELTDAGRMQLQRELSAWDRFAAAVHKVLHAPEFALERGT